MTDVFREVEEDLRHERLKSLWDRFGIYIIGICFGIVAAVGGMKWWQYHQQQVSEEAGAIYLQAVDLASSGKTDEATKVFDELAEDGPTGYATLARFQTAANLAQNGDTQGAIGQYVELANDESLDDLLKGLANIRAALLMIENGTFQDIRARVEKLNTRDGPWRNSAREVLGLAAYKAGSLEQADEFYTEIIGDPAAPPSMKQRAQVMLSLLAPEQKPASADGKADSTQTQ